MSRSPRRVHLFVPCMAEMLAPEIAFAAGQCLEAAGCEVIRDPRSACCGQMFLNSGRPRDAARLARRFVRVHAAAEAVVNAIDTGP